MTGWAEWNYPWPSVETWDVEPPPRRIKTSLEMRMYWRWRRGEAGNLNWEELEED
jgi:hypothetical protein